MAPRAAKGSTDVPPEARKSRLGQKRNYVPSTNAENGSDFQDDASKSIFGGSVNSDPPTPRIKLQPLGKSAVPKEVVAAVEQTSGQRSSTTSLPELGSLPTPAAASDDTASRASVATEKKHHKKTRKSKVPALQLGKARATRGMSALDKARAEYEAEVAMHGTAAKDDTSHGFGYGRGAAGHNAALQSRPRSLPKSAGASALPWNKDGPKNYCKPWEGLRGGHANSRGVKDILGKAANVIRDWWVHHRANLDHYHLRVLFYRHEKEASNRMGDFKRNQLHLIQTEQRHFSKDADFLKSEIKQQSADWTAAMDLRAHAAQEEELMLSARGMEAENVRARMKRAIEEEEAAQLMTARRDAEERRAQETARRADIESKKIEEERQLNMHLAQAKAEAEILAQIDPIRRFLDAEVEADDGFYQDPKTKLRYPKSYALGPVVEVEGEEKKGDEALAQRRKKMVEDWVLLMRAQTFLPAASKNLMRFMAKSWENAMPSHWYEIIRHCYDKGIISINVNPDGNATEVWF